LSTLIRRVSLCPVCQHTRILWPVGPCNFVGCNGIEVNPTDQFGTCQGPHSGCPCEILSTTSTSSTSTSTVVTTTTSAQPSATSGFWIVGLKVQENGPHDSVEVVPDAGNNCQNIVTNEGKYAAFAVTEDASGNINAFLTPEQLISTNQFFLAQAAGTAGPGGPICGVNNLVLTLTASGNSLSPFSEFISPKPEFTSLKYTSRLGGQRKFPINWILCPRFGCKHLHR